METVSGFNPEKQSNRNSHEKDDSEPVYRYVHGCHDFRDVEALHGFDPQEVTLRSYGDNAEAYAAIEWNEELIEAVWQAHKEAFKLVQELPPGDDGFVHVLVGGEGTGRDLIYFVLLNQFAKVVGYDAAPEMVLKSQEMINGEEVGKVVDALIKKKGLKGVIADFKKIEKNLFKIFKNTHNYVFLTAKLIHEIGGFNDIEFAATLERINNIISQEKSNLFIMVKEFIHTNVSLHLNSHQNLKHTYPQESFDVIFQNATYQHLSKIETRQVIAEHLALLRVKGRLYMNLRVSETGEVFCDNRLNPSATGMTDSGMRYYTTFTPQQILELVAEIESGALFKKLGIVLPEGARFQLVGR